MLAKDSVWKHGTAVRRHASYTHLSLCAGPQGSRSAALQTDKAGRSPEQRRNREVALKRELRGGWRIQFALTQASRVKAVSALYRCCVVR